MITIQLLQRISLALSVFFALCYLYQTAYLFLPLLPRRKGRPLDEGTPRLILGQAGMVRNDGVFTLILPPQSGAVFSMK